MELSQQNILQFQIQEAYADYVDLYKEEIDDGYSDAMQSMERTEARGYLNGLQTAHMTLFGFQHDFPQDFDPYAYDEAR